MSQVLKASSDDLAGFDAVVSGAEAMLSGMGYVLNAAGSSVVVKPPKRNATAAPPTCAPYDFTCTEPKQEANGNSTDEEETVELDEESSKVCCEFVLDLFSLYVLFSHCRSRDGTSENCFFQMSSYPRAFNK